jgi:hypothetical protein
MISHVQDKETLLTLWRRHVAIADALAEVLKVMSGDADQAELAKQGKKGGREKSEIKLLPAPSKKKRRRRSGEPVIHDIEGTDVEVTQLQSEILDALEAAPGALLANDIAKTLGQITPAGVVYAIKDLRARMEKAGCKAELNGYRGKGFLLEIDRGEE